MRQFEEFGLPARMRHQVQEAVKINQLVLRCLNKHPKPTDMAASIVPAIRNQLRELRHVNKQVAKMCAGWLDRAEA